MVKRGKKYKTVIQKIDKTEMFPAEQAIVKAKELAFAKFDESVDVALNLGIDPSKGEQVVRGSVVLPYGKGKKVRVIAFAKGEYADQALKAGADEVGLEDLIEKIQGGWMEFDYAVATPDVMGQIGVLAKILGPKGLLPNKKVGTVTFDVASVIDELKKGRMFFRNDKGGIVHFCIGKVSFDAKKLFENLQALIKSVVAARPATAKGKYLKKVTISTTMGVGILVNSDELLRTL